MAKKAEGNQCLKRRSRVNNSPRRKNAKQSNKDSTMKLKLTEEEPKKSISQSMLSEDYFTTLKKSKKRSDLLKEKLL